MQGVQILNEFMYEGAVVMSWSVIGISCCSVGLMGLMLSLVFRKKIATCIFIFSIILFVSGWGICIFAPRELTPRYQVIIEDDVNFNDFVNKYKIIEQNGLIYTVEERE